MPSPGDDIDLAKVKSVIQQKRAASGVHDRIQKESTDALKKLFDSNEVSPEMVKEVLRQTRACAVQNAQSSQQLKDVQESTPSRGIKTPRRLTPRPPVANPPPQGVPLLPPESNKKEKLP